MADLFNDGYALLIGVGADLPETVRDAKSLYDLFTDRNRAAYPPKQVTLLKEDTAKRENVLDEFDKFIERVNTNPNSTALVYYSGHGGEYEHAHQATEYFLCPYGYDPDHFEATALTGIAFTNKIQALKSKKLIVILDCCHAGGIPSFKSPGEKFTKSAAPPTLLQALQGGTGQVVIASSYSDELSLGGMPNSVFTTVLLEALEGKAARTADGYARVLDVLSYLFDQVPKRAAPHSQHPFVNRIVGLSNNFELCYYAGGAKSAPAVSPAARPLIPYDSWELHKLEVERKALRPAYDLRAEKIGFLEGELPLQVSPMARFAVMKELAREKSEYAELQARLDEIESVLKRL
jgi:hypothetical protein